LFLGVMGQYQTAKSEFFHPDLYRFIQTVGLTLLMYGRDYMLLGQIVAISFAQNMPHLFILLSSPSALSKVTRHPTGTCPSPRGSATSDVFPYYPRRRTSPTHCPVLLIPHLPHFSHAKFPAACALPTEIPRQRRNDTSLCSNGSQR